MSNEQMNFDFIQEYIKRYNDVKQLANQYQKNPAELLDFLLNVGKEVLIKSNDEFLKELNTELKIFLNKKNIGISKDSINDFDKLLSALKSFNVSKTSEFFNEVKK